MKIKLTLFVLLTTILIVNGQNAINKNKDFVSIINDNDGSISYISQKPITNRDYLTYIVWLNYASRNYIQPIVDAFPKLDYKNLDDKQKSVLVDFDTRLLELIKLSDSIVSNYLFNINYIDYPLIGISQKQFDDFCIWLTDRYNEYMSIKKGDLSFDPNQFDDECFSTESYLCNMYTGLVKSKYRTKPNSQDYKIKWEDRFFIPKFRPLTKYELKMIEENAEFKEYKPFDFLRVWIKHYMEVDENGLTFKMGGHPVLKNYLVDNKYYLPKASIYSVDSLYPNNQDNLIKDVNIVCNSKEDKLGHLPYSIIGEDEFNNPVYIKKIDVGNDYLFPYFYRVVTIVNN